MASTIKLLKQQGLEPEINGFSIEHALMIVNLRRYMSANSYNRYISFTNLPLGNMDVGLHR